MASSNQNIDITQDKLCSHCRKYKTLSEFIQSQGKRSQEKELSICSDCSEKKKVKRPSNPEPIDEETLNQPEYPQDEGCDLEDDNEDEALYELSELEDLVARHFTDVEENGVNFSGIFEFDDEVFDNDPQVLNQDNNNNTEEDRIRNIIYHFILPVEAGSRYYWEIRKIYLHKKKAQYTGQATVYLGCTQSIN